MYSYDIIGNFVCLFVSVISFHLILFQLLSSQPATDTITTYRTSKSHYVLVLSKLINAIFGSFAGELC